MDNNEIADLIVLQIIYTFLLQSGDNKVSLVKLTNEVQNNILIKRLLKNTKLVDINDILKVIKRIFPEKNSTNVKGGFIKFNDNKIQIRDFYDKINEKSETFKRVEIQQIKEIETKIGDPRRDKLLKLYRDTVLNRLKSKQDGNIIEMYNTDKNKNFKDLETIIPSSVHELQLILQKSVSDCIMVNQIGSANYELGVKVQNELEETVQFMRRALE